MAASVGDRDSHLESDLLGGLRTSSVIGGLGISGGSYEQDQQAAEAALNSLGFEIPAPERPPGSHGTAPSSPPVQARSCQLT
ncbi:hypothetical protein [Streptomyces avermitilis]|uniref:hypothetical protein n=1 Tax=Streptomyces avermitilis TaxID=33903 RepID=UPI0033E9DFB5